MDARAEQQDLIQNPLPQLVIVEPLTRVWELDAEISKLQKQIKERLEERTAALDYAVRAQIIEDDHCRIDVKIKRFRTLDPVRFREAFPEEFMTICDVQRRELEEQMQHLGEKVQITLADKILGKHGKDRLESVPGVVTVKESISYGVLLK